MRLNGRRLAAYAGVATLALLFVALVAGVISVLTFEGPSERERIPGAQPGVPRLAGADVGRDSSTIFLADAKDPSKRRVLLQVQQEHDFGIRAAASTNGKKIAYTVLEPGSRQMEGGASLWLLDLPSGELKRLSASVDLRQTPVWSKKGEVLAARRTTEEAGSVRTQLLLFDIKTGSERELLTDDKSLSLHPFAFSRDGRRLHYAAITSTGTFLRFVDGRGEVREVARMSETVARDFSLSPDGERVLFSAPDIAASGQYLVVALRVDDGSRQLVAKGKNDHFSPVWESDGDGIAVSQQPSPGTAAGAVQVAGGGGEQALPAPETAGFDLPLGYSEDGKYLATRFVPSDATGKQTLVIVASGGGERKTAETGGEPLFIGWLP